MAMIVMKSYYNGLFCAVAFVNLMHWVKPRRVSLISLFVAFCLVNGGYDIWKVFSEKAGLLMGMYVDDGFSSCCRLALNLGGS